MKSRVLALSIAIVLTVLPVPWFFSADLGPGTARAGDRDCKALSGAAVGSQVSPSEIVGTALFEYDRRTYDVDIRVEIFGINPNEDGTLTVSASHAFYFRERGPATPVVGTITTRDRAVFIPTNEAWVFTISAVSPVTGGSGIFAMAHGQLAFEGTADLNSGRFESAISGSLCRS